MTTEKDVAEIRAKAYNYRHHIPFTRVEVQALLERIDELEATIPRVVLVTRSEVQGEWAPHLSDDA